MTASTTSPADYSFRSLRGARFVDQDLAGADFEGSDLSGAAFVRCDLRGARLSGCEVTGCIFRKCDMTEAAADGLRTLRRSLWLLRPCTILTDVEARGMNLRGSSLRQAAIFGTNLEGADLTGVVLRNSILRECRFDGSPRKVWKIRHTHILACDFGAGAVSFYVDGEGREVLEGDVCAEVPDDDHEGMFRFGAWMLGICAVFAAVGLTIGLRPDEHWFLRLACLLGATPMAAGALAGLGTMLAARLAGKREAPPDGEGPSDEAA